MADAIAVSGEKYLGSESSSFGSYNVTLSDDQAFNLPLPVDHGFVFVSSKGTTSWAIAWCRGSATVSIQTGTDFAVASNTVLTGTTGTDGKSTLSTSEGVFYLENRSGNSTNYSISFIGICHSRA